MKHEGKRCLLGGEELAGGCCVQEVRVVDVNEEVDGEHERQLELEAVHQGVCETTRAESGANRLSLVFFRVSILDFQRISGLDWKTEVVSAISAKY